MNTPNDTGILQLWPTQFMQRVIPGAAQPNAGLLAMIQLEQASNPTLTTDYTAKDFFAQEAPAAKWLEACINKSVIDYLSAMGMTHNVDWSIQAWPNVNQGGDYHNLHNHPHSYLSGTYYIQVPPQQRYPNQRIDNNPGCISFFDPRGQANMTAIAGDAQIDAEHRVLPEEGMMLLWPSFLHHFVHPNQSDLPRVSVSFNILLQWRDSYRPAQ